MTVQAAVRMWSRHDANVTAEGGRKYKASVREAYQVVCDRTDTLRDVSNAPSLPKLNDLYPGSSQIRVKVLSPRQVSPVFWIVEVSYEGEFGPQGIDQSPLQQKPTIKWGKIESDEPIDQDYSGKPIVTVNGEPIEGVTKKVSDITCTISRNYAGIDLAATHKYLHSVNSDSFLGFAAGVVRLVDYSANEEFAEDIGGYWSITASFVMRYPYNTTAYKAWWARVRHEGYKIKVPDTLVGPVQPGQENYTIQNAKDKSGQPVNKPVLLKADGTIETNPDAAHWLEFQIYQYLPYNALGLL